MRTTRPCLFGAEFPAGRATLLLNLGSPDSPSVPDVRDYLRTFLMDRRIIGISYPFYFGCFNEGQIHASHVVDEGARSGCR